MAIKNKLKPLMPSLKERKRYLAFEIISEGPINEFKAVSEAIWSSVLGFLGELETGKAGIWIMPEKWNEQKQRGLIRVNHRYVEKLKASLALVEEIQQNNVIVKSVGTSGIIKKAEGKYLAA